MGAGSGEDSDEGSGEGSAKYSLVAGHLLLEEALVVGRLKL